MYALRLQNTCASRRVSPSSAINPPNMKEDFKPEKKVADLYWPMTDSIHINYKRMCKIV